MELSLPQSPARFRINWRMMALAAVVVGILGVPVYSFLSEAMTGGIHADGRVDLKRLGQFMIDPTDGTIDDVPARYRALDGKRIVLEGFMFPWRDAGPRLSDFQFVYNIQKCCFGGPPLPQERVFGTVANGKKVDYLEDQCRIVGILHVKVQKDAGKIVSVYTMDVEKVSALN